MFFIRLKAPQALKEPHTTNSALHSTTRNTHPLKKDPGRRAISSHGRTDNPDLNQDTSMALLT